MSGTISSVHPEGRTDGLSKKFVKTVTDIQVNGSNSRQTVLFDLAQTEVVPTQVNYKQKSVVPQPSETIFQNVNPNFIIYLEPYDCSQMKNVWLEFDITHQGSAPLFQFPIFQMVKRVEYWVRGGMQLQFVYPIDYIRWLHDMGPCKARRLKEFMNFETFECQEFTRFGLRRFPEQYKRNNYKVYLPLIGILGEGIINMNTVRHDIEVRVYFEDDWLSRAQDYDATIIYGDVVLNNVNWIFLQDDMTSHEENNSQFAGQNRGHRFLETTIIKENQKSLPAATQVKFDLRQIDGVVPYLLFYIKETVNPQGIDRLHPIPIGDSDGFDVLNATNESLWGNGQHVRERLVRDLNKRQLDNWYRGYYYIPFCDDIRRANKGILDGVHYFDQSTSYLSVYFGPAVVAPSVIQEVLHITRGAAITTQANMTDVHNDTGFTNNVAALATDAQFISEWLAASDALNACGVKEADLSLDGAGWQAVARDINSDGVFNFGMFRPALRGSQLSSPDAAHGFEKSGANDVESWVTGSDFEVNIACPIYKTLYINKLGQLSVKKLV